MAYLNGYRRSQYLFTRNAIRQKTLNRNIHVFRGGLCL